MESTAAAINAETKLMCVGYIAGAQGIKGWVKIHSDTEPRTGIFDYRPWVLMRDRALGLKISADAAPNRTLCEVIDWQAGGKVPVAKLSGIDSREQAEALRGSVIYVVADQMQELEAGEYYWHQLIGLEVFSQSGDAADVKLGRVIQLLETGANDVLVVEPCEGSLDQRERLIPWTPGVHVLNVDLQGQRIEVDWDPSF